VKWTLVVLVLSGCPVPEPVEDAGTLPDGGACQKELVLGTETDLRQFVPISEGSDLKINAGPQGGWHVWVSVRASAWPRTGTLTYTLRSGGGAVSSPLRIDLGEAFLDSITCGWERRSDALTFNVVGENFRGAAGEVEMTYEAFGAAPTTVKRG
jgi:hypothetical protein